MADSFTSFSNQIADAVAQAGASVVQVSAHRRPVTGVVFAEDQVLVPAHALDDDNVAVRRGDGHTVDGQVLGRGIAPGFAVVRAASLGVPPIVTAPEPRVGHLAIAIGRTFSGGVMASVTNVAVIGGPLRTSRTSRLDRVIRIAQPPHGAFTGGVLVDGAGLALGVITGAEIRGTTVVGPSSVAWDIAGRIAASGGTRQGFLGVTTTTVELSERQRGGRGERFGLLVTGLVDDGPAAQAGVFVGDIILSFDGAAVQEPEELVMRLRGNRVGQQVSLQMLRGGSAEEIRVTIGERPRRS
jgi:S1-C subfamily serine protease